MNDTAPDAEVSPEDMKAARAMLQGLLDDLRRQERDKKLLAAVVTWTNAFSSFKRLRNDIGLPTGKDQQLHYGAILGSLKAAGKMLLVWVKTSGCDLTQADISLPALQACVEELIEDDRILDRGLLEDDFADFEQTFCKA